MMSTSALWRWNDEGKRQQRNPGARYIHIMIKIKMIISKMTLQCFACPRILAPRQTASTHPQKLLVVTLETSRKMDKGAFCDSMSDSPEPEWFGNSACRSAEINSPILTVQFFEMCMHDIDSGLMQDSLFPVVRGGHVLSSNANYCCGRANVAIRAGRR